MEDKFLIVGLGNPGKEYAVTRHNIGFMTIERLAKRFALDWRVNKKFTAHLAGGNQGDATLLLCQPQGYMNVVAKPLRRWPDFTKSRPIAFLSCWMTWICRLARCACVPVEAPAATADSSPSGSVSGPLNFRDCGSGSGALPRPGMCPVLSLANLPKTNRPTRKGAGKSGGSA